MEMCLTWQDVDFMNFDQLGNLLFSNYNKALWWCFFALLSLSLVSRKCVFLFFPWINCKFYVLRHLFLCCDHVSRFALCNVL